MCPTILILHTDADTKIAEMLAGPLQEAGYEVFHGGCILVGDSLYEKVNQYLLSGSPIVLCGTVRAIGTNWARKIINAAKSVNPSVVIIPVHVEKDADIDALAFDLKVASYWKDPSGAINEILDSLRKRFPIHPRSESLISNMDDESNLQIIDFSSYFSFLRKRYRIIDLEGLTPPDRDEYLQLALSSVFVEQNARKNMPPQDLPRELWQRVFRNEDVHPEELPKGLTMENIRKAREKYFHAPAIPILDIITDLRNSRVVILGDPGAGKSTLVRYLLLLLIDSSEHPSKEFLLSEYVPFLIELRSFTAFRAKGTGENIIDFLNYNCRTEGWQVPSTGIETFFREGGKALLLFDGLDEIFDPHEREHIANQINGIANLYPNVRIVVTSRIVGYQYSHLMAFGFEHYVLEEFLDEQIFLFLKQWFTLIFKERPHEYDSRLKRVKACIQESPSIRQLAGNPMLLTILAIIGKNQELPRERWKLYEHAASVLIHQWDVNKHIKGLKGNEEFGDTEKKELLRALAYKMQCGIKGMNGNYIEEEDLQMEFEEYFIKRFKEKPRKAAGIARAMVEQFHSRNFILSKFGTKEYGFVHRTFLEYFCADSILYRFEKTRELSLSQLKGEIFSRNWRNDNWREVLRLVCGMLGEKFAGQIIDYILEHEEYEINELDGIIIRGHYCPKQIDDLDSIRPIIQ